MDRTINNSEEIKFDLNPLIEGYPELVQLIYFFSPSIGDGVRLYCSSKVFSSIVNEQCRRQLFERFVYFTRGEEEIRDLICDRCGKNHIFGSLDLSSRLLPRGERYPSAHGFCFEEFVSMDEECSYRHINIGLYNRSKLQGEQLWETDHEGQWQLVKSENRKHGKIYHNSLEGGHKGVISTFSSFDGQELKEKSIEIFKYAVHNLRYCLRSQYKNNVVMSEEEKVYRKEMFQTCTWDQHSMTSYSSTDKVLYLHDSKKEMTRKQTNFYAWKRVGPFNVLRVTERNVIKGPYKKKFRYLVPFMTMITKTKVRCGDSLGYKKKVQYRDNGKKIIIERLLGIPEYPPGEKHNYIVWRSCRCTSFNEEGEVVVYRVGNDCRFFEEGEFKELLRESSPEQRDFLIKRIEQGKEL